MKYTWAILVLSGIGLLAGPLMAYDVHDPPAGMFSDEWSAIYLSGAKSGHAHMTIERIDRPEGAVIRSHTRMYLEIGRVDAKIHVSVDAQAEETLDGRPLGFEHTVQLGRLPAPTTIGRIADGKVTVTTTQFGLRAMRKVYDLPEGAVMTWGTTLESDRRGLEPGTRYTLLLYEPSTAPDRAIVTGMGILDRETIDVFGRKVEAIKTLQRMQLGPDGTIDTTSWITDDFDVLKTQMKLMDFELEIVSCPKPVALAPNEPTELMQHTLIALDGEIDRDRAEMTYELSTNDPSSKTPLGVPPETSMQRVREVGSNRVRITVTRRRDDVLPAKKQILTEVERERYRSATTMLDYEDEVVARLARQAAGGVTDPNERAERLCRFVTDYIKRSRLNVGFATASEVARSREGDCSEHGVLLAALGRALGIPTRLVAGVVYAEEFAGRRRVFVGHMWTQFFIDGRWIDLDSAFRQVVPDVTHIALSLSDAGAGSLADLTSALWMNLGRMKLKPVPGPHAATQPQDRGNLPPEPTTQP